ncbi:hypothetical protein Droror1_Dr00004043 [Drosera rotundifolia]
MSPAKRSNKEKEKVVVRRTTRSSVLQVSVEKNNNDKDITEIVKEVDKKTEEVVRTTVIVEDADRDAEDLLVHLLDGDGDKILKPVKAGSEPEKTAQVEKGPAREKQIETPSKGGKEPAQKEPETPAQVQHERRAQESTEEEQKAQQGEPAQEEEEDEETQEPESPIVYEEGPKPNEENTIQTPPREKEGPTDTAQQEKIKKRRGRKRRERGGGGQNGGYGRYIYKVLKQVHPELGVSSKAMTVLDNYIGDMFERLATEAARLGDYAKKRTLTSREVQGAVRLVLPGELGKHAIAEGSKAVSNFMTFDD